MEKVVRRIVEEGGILRVCFFIYKGDSREWMLIDKLAKLVSEKYNVSYTIISEKLCELTKDIRDLSEEKIDKRDKSADEIKREIIEATRVRESILREITKVAEELAEKQKIDDWLWYEAVFDWNRLRFIPTS